MITAIVTYYNKPIEQLKRCIDSLNEFSIPWILVDDCSDSRPNYPHIRTSENLGPYGAFAVGLELVTTPWVLRIDADDYLTDKPVFNDSFDCWTNCFNHKIKITPHEFRGYSYAGLTVAAIKTDICRKVWLTDMRQFGDIVIFHRLLLKYKVAKYAKDCYHYVPKQPGSITATPWNIRKRWINIAKERMLKEAKNGEWN